MKLKKYELHWEATVKGVQVVEAFDEDDAEEQFDRWKHVEDIAEEPFCADLEFVSQVNRKRLKQK